MTAETRKGSSRSEGTESVAPLAALLRRHDRDRFQTALFAPAERREALLALYAFNYEIARVRETVTEPMLGQIRLQWWREVVAAAFAGEPPRQHLVAVPLTAAIRDCRLTRAHFGRLIDTRERDLVDEPPTDFAALREYAEGTSVPLVQLALEILGVQTRDAQETARQVGIGYALAGLLRAMPFHAGAGRSFIPEEIAGRFGLGWDALWYLAELRSVGYVPFVVMPLLVIWLAGTGQLAALAARRYAPYPAAAELPPTGPLRRVVRGTVLTVRNRRRRPSSATLPEALEG